MLVSQELRKKAPELDPLRLGSGWSLEELKKPQVIVESSFGHSHPGSAHLDQLVEAGCKGIQKAGGKGAKYFVTDICDGEAQGHDGMNYSLLSRDVIASMVEIHVRATPFDGGVFITSCDKSMPAHLIAIARLNIPSIVVPGGVMKAGSDGITLEQIGTYSAMYERGEITEEEFDDYKQKACPSCGACSFMGTASSMQIVAEALGLALPGSALIPVTSNKLEEAAIKAGEQVLELIQKQINPVDILTEKAFENAIMVHAAIAGSTNSLLHLPAIAKELGVTIKPELFDKIHREVPYITNIRPSGQYPAEYFWYAGGVPAVMEQIKDHLHLDVLTVTGKTVGDNLEELKSKGYFEACKAHLDQLGVEREDIIISATSPINSSGAVAVLKGNLAPDGAVVKHSALKNKFKNIELEARVFDSEESTIEAIFKDEIKPGQAIIIRYEGPKGSGMPEMFYTTEAIASNEALAEHTALITDGRFSGATRGPAIGHVSPEAVEGGPIALVEDGDIIKIDINERTLNIVGTSKQKLSPEEVDKLLEKRRKKWCKPQIKQDKGILGLYKKTARSATEGGVMV